MVVLIGEARKIPWQKSADHVKSLRLAQRVGVVTCYHDVQRAGAHALVRQMPSS